MSAKIIGQIEFPEFTGIKCNMMPFIQGNSNSLPKEYKPYSSIIDSNFLEYGEIGFLTIDESYVEKGKSQRGFNSAGIERNVHVEVGRFGDVYRWGGGGWHGKATTILLEDTKVLISNSVSDTCRVWNSKEKSFTKDGDLSEYINKYPDSTGRLMKAGELAQIDILTPHECVTQSVSGLRQFFRIIGKGVIGKEDYFTVNPLLS